MANQAEHGALNAREEWERFSGKSSYELYQFKFTGNTSDVAFTMERGWKPVVVTGTAGDIKIEGSSDDYTTSQHLGIYTVTFAVAPSAADFLIFGELDL